MLALVLVVSGVSGSAAGDEPTLDELLDLGPAAEEEVEQPAEDGAAEPADGLDGLDEATVEELERMLEEESAGDVFEQAVAQMGRVARRLGEQGDGGADTQRQQERIIRMLEQVLESARQSQLDPDSDGEGGGGGDPDARESDAGDDPAQSQRDQQGQADADAAADEAGGEEASTGESGEADARRPEEGGPLDELGREWGQLPPRLRDEVNEGLNEPFSPVYRRLTEQYYRRLAEEQDE